MGRHGPGRVRLLTALLALSALTAATPGMARKIGTIEPSLPLSAERIASLPRAERAAWTAYFTRSAEQMRADKAALAAELPPGATPPPSPPGGGGELPGGDPDYFRSAGARAIADTIVSFQTPAGGWGKNTPRTIPPRQLGQHYIHEETPGSGGARDWAFVGTIDNSATTSEIAYLERVIAATGKAGEARYGAAVRRGVDYLLAAQYPTGGWPQVWPLMGGYHNAITYNDDAMARVIRLLIDVGAGKGGYATLSADQRARADRAVKAGIDCILRTQIVVNGVRTGWAQQHDPITLKPVTARAYEPAELTSAESVRLLSLLMALPNPSPAVRRAIADGMAWVDRSVIRDVAWTKEGGNPRFVQQKGAVLWSRFYRASDNLPIFGDRDRSLYDDVMDISAERRGGYAWFNKSGLSAQAEYARWKKANGG